MARVAAALGDLLPEVVFIGGAIAPLLHTDSPFDRPRPTKDTDGVIASASYGDLGRLHKTLRELGFRQDLGTTQHLHRWVSPHGDLFDLVPAGQHPGGSGQLWDQIALETSVDFDLGAGVTVRYACASAFLALKWAAYLDRGKHDPHSSHDLEDIFALLAARPSIVEEVRNGRYEVRSFLAEKSRDLVRTNELGDLLAGHLNNAQDPNQVMGRVRERLIELAQLA